MAAEREKSEFPEHSVENHRIWETNALWWDDQIGGGNDFQTLLIEPATERLLAISDGDLILDIACGAGRFARRMIELGARVFAFDLCAQFIERARERTAGDAPIEYRVLDATSADALLTLGEGRFDKAVCTMALMDMPEITPLLSTLPRLLKPDGSFVFSVTHPCFNSTPIQRFAETHEEEAGRLITRTGVKVSSYLTPFAKKTEGIIGQPEPHWYYHRPVHVLFESCFAAGFVADGIEEPRFPDLEDERTGVRWRDMPDIPPVLVARMRKNRSIRPST